MILLYCCNCVINALLNSNTLLKVNNSKRARGNYGRRLVGMKEKDYYLIAILVTSLNLQKAIIKSNIHKRSLLYQGTLLANE